jgi:uncharacterized membrane protein
MSADVIDAYSLVKWLHVLGATVIFGTGIGTAFHFWIATRRESVDAIAAAARSTVLADYCFTLPAVIVQPLTGLALARMAGYPLTAAWLVGAFALYALAAACWIPVVLIQLRLARLAAASASAGTPLPAQFHRLSRVWFALGWPAFLAMAATLWLMVARPA